MPLTVKMNATEIYQQFINDISHTTWYEYVAVFTGIASVWYSRKENILVYPTGLEQAIVGIIKANDDRWKQRLEK